MPNLSGELAYLFRHALLREGAYQLQTPSSRGQMHRLVLEILEAIDWQDTGAIALDMARHAEFAQEGADQAVAASLRRKQGEYLLTGAQWCRRSGRHLDARAAARQAAGLDGLKVHTRVEAKLLSGKLALDSNLPVEALAEARTLFEIVEDDSARARALHLAASSHAQLAQWKEAEKFFADAAEAARRAKAPVLVADALQGRGGVATQDLRPAEAVPLLEEALAIYRREGAKEHLQTTLGNLAAAWYRQQDYARSRQYAEEAIDAAVQVGAEWSIAPWKNTLGAIAYQSDDPAAALPHYLSALELARKHGVRRHEALSLSNLGIHFTVQKEYAKARPYAEQAIEAHRESGNTFFLGDALNFSGVVEKNLGRFDAAQAYFEEAIDIFRASQRSPDLCSALCNLSSMLRYRGRPAEEAIALANEAVLITADDKAKAGWAMALATCGRAWLFAATQREGDARREALDRCKELLQESQAAASQVGDRVASATALASALAADLETYESGRESELLCTESIANMTPELRGALEAQA